MKRYAWRACREGRPMEEGVLSAEDRRSAARALQERGYTVVRLREKRRPLLPPRPVRGRALALFCREWAALLAAGIPLTEALGVIAGHGSRAMKRTLGEVARLVASGEPLAEALRESGRFPPFFTAMAAVGERSGTLPEQLDALGAYYERAAAVRRQFASALAYPLFVLCFALAMFVLVLTVIVPSFSLLFDALGLPLPPLTRGALALGLFLRAYGAAFAGAALCAGALCFAWTRTARGRRAWERALFHSRFVRRLALIRCCAALAAFLQSGSPLSEALAAAEASAGSGEARRRIALVRQGVARGGDFAACLLASGLASPMAARMAAAGTESGELPRFLRMAARLLTDETERKLVRLRAALEPALLLFVGALTAAVVFTVMIPVFTAAGRGL